MSLFFQKCCLLSIDVLWSKIFQKIKDQRFFFVKSIFFLVIAPHGSHNHQDVHEQVDHVQVDVQGGEDVLLGAEGVLVTAAHHKLGVVHDVQGENQGAGRSISDLSSSEK